MSVKLETRVLNNPPLKQIVSRGGSWIISLIVQIQISPTSLAPLVEVLALPVPSVGGLAHAAAGAERAAAQPPAAAPHEHVPGVSGAGGPDPGQDF